MTRRNYRIGLLAIQLTLTTVATAADDTAAEIQYLLEEVGASHCTFVRNGERHSAQRAEDHLRMKYNKASKYIDDAEEFIDKIASQSSWTGEPYAIECPNAATESSRSWLLARLQSHRGN
jgi:hypothetical protein